MPEAPVSTRPLPSSAVSRSASTTGGLLSFVLHAHLPWVVGHGTWPHGMEWLHEAAAETYLPLLRILDALHRDGVPFHCTLVLSPVLLEQLAHPVFLAEFPRYLDRKITAAEEDHAFFEQSGELHYSYLAHFWRDRFLNTREHFQQLTTAAGSDASGPILTAIRRLQTAGSLFTLTSSATHGFLPLLGTDESLRAQLQLAIETHRRHLGVDPVGLWSPECGYRPAGLWQQPVPDAGTTEAPPAFVRPGLEELFSEHGLHLFFVDTHLVEDSQTSPSRNGNPNPSSLLYQPLQVAGSSVSAFPRDPHTGAQVWSADGGYPGEPAYLDFYKKRWPGGHRYWRVTDWHTGMGEKAPYNPGDAASRVAAHAAHFVDLLRQTLAGQLGGPTPPVLTAPFDAELFGHWWFEGPDWLEAVARNLHSSSGVPTPVTAAEALHLHPPTESIALGEGSWGAGGDDRVWLNAETAPVWAEIYRAEHLVRDLSSAGLWRNDSLSTRILAQLCRELLLLESSDWPFLITTGAARDYAEARIRTHLDQFQQLHELWSTLHPSAGPAPSVLSSDQLQLLSTIEQRDNLFPNLDPALWAVRP